MEYIYFPFLYETPLLYRTFPDDTTLRLSRTKLVHEYSKDVYIAE